MLHFIDNEHSENFVRPELCNDLLNLGLTPNTPFQWRVYPDGRCLLYTHDFDFDNYYKEGMKLQDVADPPDYILPAYTLMKIEKMLPNYLVNKIGVEYEVCPEKVYINIGCHKSNRLPDAFALLLKEMLEKRKVNKEQVHQNLVIASKR